MHRSRLRVILACILVGLCLISAQLGINHVTASGRPRPLWRGSLPNVDLGIDTWPAEPGYGGYIEIWYQSHGAQEHQPLLNLPGTPALPVPPEPRPGEISA
jgi:hypothetical protein